MESVIKNWKKIESLNVDNLYLTLIETDLIKGEVLEIIISKFANNNKNGNLEIKK